MKRLLSILLLIIFLFNLGGYHLVFWSMELQAKKSLLTRLDANALSENELIVLTIPISLPYAANSGFQSVDGEFLHQGEYYKLIRQKYENDTLFIVCVKDEATAKINRTLTDYSKVANSLPVGSKQALNFIGKLYKDFNSSEFKYNFVGRMVYDQILVAHVDAGMKVRYLSIESPPPELA